MTSIPNEPASAPAPLVLAIDVGTSSTRAILFGADGTALPDSEAQVAHEFEVDSTGAVVADANRLFTVAIEVVDAVLERNRVQPGEVVAVGVSCFWHSLLALDRDGQPLTPIVSWADTRSVADAEALKQLLDEAATHARTGCVFHTSYWPAKLRWLERTDRDRRERTCFLGGYAEYLFLRLCGRFVTTISMASGTGLFDQHRADWDAPLLDLLQVERARLPEVVDRDDPSVRLTPEYAARWPALAGIPWFPAVGDGAASNVGSGCVDSRRMALSVGTSGVMRLLVPGSTIDIPPGLWCYRLDRHRFVVGGALSNAGNAVAWLGEALTLPEDADRAIAALAPGAHGLAVLPYFTGERTPEWNPLARAAIVGLGLHSTPIEMLRATLEAVACRFALVHDLLRPLAAPGYDIIGSGGGLEHWKAWCQIITDALGYPVALARESEASARGAALLALESLGLIASLDAIPTPLAAVFAPEPSAMDAYRVERARIERLTYLLRDSSR